jgi:methionine synthase I (cobalamin-dependent)
VNHIIDNRERCAPAEAEPIPSIGQVGGRFLAALSRGPLVLDAAMGTRLCARGLNLRSDDPCLWNLTHPAEVLDLHDRDVSAGSQVLVTNTFGANRFWLTKFGRADAVAAINGRAVALARRAIGSGGFVVGDIGPTAAQEAGAAAEQAAALIDSGVDAIVFETYRAEPLFEVLHEIQLERGAAVPILVSLWQWPEPPEATARQLLDRGVTAIGINCQPLDTAIALARRLDRVVSCPLLVKPSAAAVGDSSSNSTPAAFAAAVPQFVAWNVRLIGGCCGTTAAHVDALAAACSPYQTLNRTDPIGAHP